jgi:hypothetical protein
MTDHCACCGRPTDSAETHHVDEQRGNNHPDNLSPRCRRCHHGREHDNDRATDHETTRRFGPQTPRTGPPGP